MNDFHGTPNTVKITASSFPLAADRGSHRRKTCVVAPQGGPQRYGREDFRGFPQNGPFN